MYHPVIPGGFCPAKTSPGILWSSFHLRPGLPKNHGIIIRRLSPISGKGAVVAIPVDGLSREPLG